MYNVLRSHFLIIIGGISHMQLCHKMPDISIFPLSDQMNHSEHPENYAVYNLEGTKETFYYTDGGFFHGFLNQKRIITPLCYTAYHRGFHVNGKDKYILARIANKVYAPNKLELLDLETGLPTLVPFAAWIPKGNQLAFGIDYDSGERYWGIFDLEKGVITHIPNLPTNQIREMMY